MSLTPGTTLGPYTIVGTLGAGGMGEVYRAHDARLDRDVAIKLLPDSFANDPERLARFEREAKTLASLNHPHIAQVFGLEIAPSTGSGQAPVRGLVMELVEGEDLSRMIQSGSGSGEPDCRLRKPFRSRNRSPKRLKPRTTPASSIAI